MKRVLLFLAIFSGIVTIPCYAQFYSDGQDPFSTRWRQIKTPRYQLIYPDTNEIDARRVAAILDTSMHALHFGYTRPGTRLPIILHTQNLHANGVVVWTPKRSELVTTPPTDTYAMPWLKQVTIHEYRHVVQTSNLNRHVIKLFSYLGGEQVTGAAAAFLPKWFLEGDAVLAETAMASYGRALQPEFTLVYRGYLADDELKQFCIDKWFCGSYRDFIPNHYNLGYQLTNASYRYFGPEIWEKVTEYTTRRPYTILPRMFAFKKYYNTSSGKLLRRTFGELKTIWDPEAKEPNSAQIIETPSTSYTLYSYPTPVGDSLIVALKYDLDKPNRWVVVNSHTAEERLLAYTGNVSSRPVYTNGELLWTEYQPSTFWEQKNRSVLRRMALDTPHRAKTLSPDQNNLFYITPHGSGFAAIAYDPARKYALRFFDAGFQPQGTLPLPDSISIHGMAWDEVTNTLALITLSEAGMALMGVDPRQSSLYTITPPSFVTINHLTAGEGKLFFNSILSGKDEIHCHDLRTGQEFRLTTSRFGSVMPSIRPTTGEIVQATYRRDGYFVSTQPLDTSPQKEVFYQRLPENRLNAPLYDWGLPNIDSMRLYDTARSVDSDKSRSKRYRKGSHLFNFHSWAPLSYDVFELADERNFELELGATVITHNALSNTEGYFSYGRVEGNNWWRGGLRFLALAPKIEISAEYDGGKRLIYIPSAIDPGAITRPSGTGKKYFSLDAEVYLPFNLSLGATLRSLTPSVKLTHYNAMMYNPGAQKFDKGYEKSEVSLSYAQSTRTAYRDLAPRWGFAVKGSWISAPFLSTFGEIYSLYANVYLPGIMPHHSLRLRGVTQYQHVGTYNFVHDILFPRGCQHNFAADRLWATLADYRFPVAYPDWGIPEVIYIKRISANLFGGYSRYRPIRPNARYGESYSYGCEVTLDTNPLRMPGTGMSLRGALYKSSDSKRLGYGFGVGFTL